MAAHILFTVAALALLAGSASAAESDVFHVAGSVLCQDCSEGWTQWVNGANPIQGTYGIQQTDTWHAF